MAKRIALIDPGLYSADRNSPNIGDLIISRASHREIYSIFGNDATISQVPSHSVLSRSVYESLEEADHIIVGGSNLLWFRFFPLASWPLRLRDLFRLRNVVTLGVGWGSYNLDAGRYSKFAAQKVFSEDMFLSARDSYTKEIMTSKLGLKNAINTGCHTTWRLSQSEDDYQTTIGSTCVFSLTDYAKAPLKDKCLIQTLERLYGKKTLFWPQGSGDLNYVKELGYKGECLPEDLDQLISAFSALDKPDYVGTRLHAGILAMEFGIRSLIIGVDNRAIEIARDINLNLILRDEIQELEGRLIGDMRTELMLSNSDIKLWQEQFNVG